MIDAMEAGELESGGWNSEGLVAFIGDTMC